jgi:hypothetical protein
MIYNASFRGRDIVWSFIPFILQNMNQKLALQFNFILYRNYTTLSLKAMCIVYTNEHGVDTNSGYWKIEHSIVP